MKGPSLTVEESIRLEAYLLSEKAGHPHGMDARFWAQAEAIVQGRTAAPPVEARKPAKTTAKAQSQVAAGTPIKEKAVDKKAKAGAKKSLPAPGKADTQLLLAPELPAAKAPVKKPAAPKKVAKPEAAAPAQAAKAPAKSTAKKK